MKTRLLNIFWVLFFLFTGMTVMAEDFMTVYYHDGTHKMFLVSDIEHITMSHLDVDSVTHNDFQSQIVETDYGTYIQMINQIDSVVFTHVDMAYPRTDYELEATSQLAPVISKRSNDIVDSLINLNNLNPVTVINEFMKIPDVIDVTIDDDLHSVTMLRTDSIYQHFIFNDEFDETIQPQSNQSHRNPKIAKNQKFIPNRKASQLQKQLSVPLHEYKEERIIKDIKSVLVLAPFENMNPMTGGYPNEIAQLCEDIKELLDVEPIYLHDEKAVISNFEGDVLDNYDMIIICTHGGGGADKDYKMVDKNKVGIAFVSISTNADLKKLPDIRYCSIRGNYNAYLCMTEKFLDNASFNGSIVFSYACSGFDRDYAENSMTEAFIEKNASSYFGSKVTVYNWLNENVTNNIVRSFCAGISLQDAVSYWKDEDLCSATRFYLSKLRLKDSDYPLGYYPEALELEIKPNVPLYSRNPDPNNLYYDILNGSFSWDCQIQPFSYSFLYPDVFQNKHFPTYDVYVNGTKINNEDLTEMNFSWTPETNGTFKWYVIAKMKSKVGVNDYITTFKSEEETFTIEDYPALSLSSNEVSLIVGESSTIDITSGNGDYTVSVDKPTIATATLYGTTITIKGESKGTAKVTVKDKSGQTAEIIVSVESDYPGEDTRSLAFDYELEGTRYALYWQSEQNDVRYNADHTPYYRTKFTLDVTNNGSTKTYIVDENVYYTKEGGGQTPCMAIDLKSKKIFIFVNSSNGYSYSLDGYCFVSPLYNYNFQKEIVFTEANFGWWPYFTYNNGLLYLQHFSFAGYYAMTSTRSSNGTWTTDWGYQIYPDEFKTLSEQAGRVLIIR